MTRRKFAAYAVGGGLIAVLVAASLWLLAQPKRTAGPGMRPGGFSVPVEAQAVRVGPSRREAEAIGTLRSWESVVIKPEITGRVVKIAFEEGAVVKAGDLLVQLDSAEAEAEVLRNRATLSLAKENYERARQLNQRGAGTMANLDRAQADLATAEASLKLAEAKLAKMKLVAPFDGVLGLRKVSVGALLIPGQEIVNLEQINPLKVDFKVPEILLAAVRVGQGIRLRVDAMGKAAVEGTVYAIDPQLETGGRSIVLRARIPNADGVLRPGLFVRVVLTIDDKPNAIFIPEQSILPASDGTMSVFKAVGGKAVMTKVEIGERIKGEVEILGGLKPGDVVVTAGLPKLRPGAGICLLVGRPAPGG
ncbi:MAG: efflux RND transporter periplasmic adaptor subunit, partial [Rhodospirillaceae bacterium]|nr:efflux RND transporter periplasmic adaptor subunit [Rhodospirillaceae bacterium]